MGWELPYQTLGEANRLQMLAGRFGSAGYAGLAGESLALPARDTVNNINAEIAAHNRREAQDRERENHERGLQMQEQQRRAYDSETQRQLGQQKFSVLGNLLSGTHRVV
jgi:tRNA G37 N-methylase Trm5